MQYREQMHLYDGDIFIYLLVNQRSFEILDYNDLAKEYYFDGETLPDLKELFEEQEAFISAVENFGLEKSYSLRNLTSYRENGEVFLCDIDICFVDVEEELAFLVIKDKAKDNDPELTSLLDLSENPIVVLENNDDFTISFANYRFYQFIRKTPKRFLEELGASCVKMLAAPRRESFRQVIIKQLEQSNECNADIELNFEDDLFQLFHLNAFKSRVNGKLYGVLISVKKQSELMKKIEFDQQFFDIMQEFSKDLLFHIDIKKKTLLHRGDVSNFVDLYPIIDNFPESMRDNRLLHPDDLEGYIAFAYRLMSGLNAACELRFQLKSGNYDKYRLQGKVLFDIQGNPLQVVGKSENIQKYVEIETRANYDSLTTTLNKLSFRELVEANLERAVQTDRFALLFIDFDDFKGVNDTMGHKFGDFLLEVTGKRIINAVRNHDRVGRVGGDEFVVFFQHAPSAEAVLERAEAILYTLRRPFNDGELSYSMKASIGVALYPSHGTTYEELYDHSDVALYRSKARGKDVATIYSPIMKEEAMQQKLEKQKQND